MPELTDLDGLVDRIPDGALVAVPPDYIGGATAMALARRLVIRGVRGLRLLGLPAIGFQADMLIGAGCVSGVECAGVSLGEYGNAPRFTAAVQEGRLEIRDATCPAIHAGLQAAEKGVPFMPLRGVIGSDVLASRPDWQVIDNPFQRGDPILLLPAIRPDVAAFHVRKVDREGNAWIGTKRELMVTAHAARSTVVTYEERVEGSLLDDEATAAGTIPALYVTALAEAKNGAWPLGVAGYYPPDRDHLKLYAELAATKEGFARYLRQYVYQQIAAE